jgi:hypothetical protein
VAGEEKRKQHYHELLRLSRQIRNDARRVIAEVEESENRRKKKLQSLTVTLGQTAERVGQLIRQTRARVWRGIAQWPGRIVSLFEPHTEIIRKGKTSKPTVFGKLVRVQEAENQIITHYEVFETRLSDRELLARSVDAQERVLERVPRMVAADAGFYSREQEKMVLEKGVKRVAQIVGFSRDIVMRSKGAIPRARANSVSLAIVAIMNGALAFPSMHGVLNPAICANSSHPAWCSGLDIGAWTNAAEAYCAGRYCPIKISAGNYPFTTPIVAVSNVDLSGVGQGKTILNYSGASSTVAITAGSSTSNLSIHDFSLLGPIETPGTPSSYNTLLAISVSGTRTIVRRMTVQHFWGKSGMVEIQGTANEVSDSDLEYGRFDLGGGGSKHKFLRNYLSNHYSRASAYENPGVHYWDGFVAEGLTDSLINENRSEDNGQSGIYIGGNGSASSGNQILSNHVELNWNRGIDQGVTGDVEVGTNSLQDVMISNNIVTDNLGSNIWLVCVQRGRISGNQSSFTNEYFKWFGGRGMISSASGIVLYEGCGTGTTNDTVSYVSVTGNILRDSSGKSFAGINYNVARGVGNSVSGNSENIRDYLSPSLNLKTNIYRTQSTLPP